MSRLEILLARQAAEKLKITQPKPVTPRVKAPKPVAPPAEPEATKFNPPQSLMECVSNLTPEQASSPKNVVGTIAMFIMDELLRSPRPTMATLSDNMLDSYTYICGQIWADKPDLKRVFSCAVGIVDGIECRSGSGGEGEAITRLHQLERALVQRKLGR